MKHYLIPLFTRLYEAIKRGILRIFPLPLKPFVYVLLTLTILTFYGCATPKQTSQLVKDVRVDTVYLNSKQYDSIYIYKDRVSEHHLGTLEPSGTLKPDTIYIKDVSVEYKYRLLRDTIKVTQRDSIPYEVVRTETKEITRPLTWYDHLTRLTFWFVFGYLVSILVFKLKSIIHKP